MDFPNVHIWDLAQLLLSERRTTSERLPASGARDAAGVWTSQAVASVDYNGYNKELSALYQEYPLLSCNEDASLVIIHASPRLLTFLAGPGLTDPSAPFERGCL